MKTLLISALMALLPGLVMAQTAPAKATAKTTTKKAASKSTAKSAAKAPVAKAKAKAPAKVLVAKAAPASQHLYSAAPAITASIAASGAAAAAASQTGSTDVMAIADRVYQGRIACELGAHVTVAADPAAPGYFHVEGKNFKYYMSPVATSTGTVRLEDAKAGAVWLQIANKSMLMNQRLGQRLADECMSSEQVVVAEAIKRNPPPSVFEPLPAAK
jgi:hypothetical protein